MNAKKIVILTFMTCFFSGNSLAGSGPDYYENNQRMSMGTVREGVVLQTREVRIGGTKTATGIGAVVGGAVGGAVASNKNAGFLLSLVASTLGAAAGGALGQAVTSSGALEIVVKMGNDVRVIVQEVTDVNPRSGDRVLVLVNGSEARIVGNNEYANR